MKDKKNKNIKCDVCGIPLKKHQLFGFENINGFIVYCKRCLSDELREMSIRAFIRQIKETSDDDMLKRFGLTREVDGMKDGDVIVY